MHEILAMLEKAQDRANKINKRICLVQRNGVLEIMGMGRADAYGAQILEIVRPYGMGAPKAFMNLTYRKNRVYRNEDNNG